MAGEGLGHSRGAPGSEGDLNGTIAVRFVGLDLRNAIRQRLDDRHGDSHAGVSEYAGHAAFAANQTYGHCRILTERELRLAPAYVATDRRFRCSRPQAPRAARLSENWRRYPRAPTSKIGGRILHCYALRATSNG